MTRPHEPLTSEERALADQMGKLGPHSGPSPALDARILAAAHAAVATTNPAPRRKPRWPVALGLAASAVLAVGVAWQLRPLQETAFERHAAAAVSAAPTRAITPAEDEQETPATRAVETYGPAADNVAEPSTEMPSATFPAPPSSTTPPHQSARKAPATTQPQSAPAPAPPPPPSAIRQERATDTFLPPPPPPPPAPPAPAAAPTPMPALPVPSPAAVADDRGKAMELAPDFQEVVVTGSRVTTSNEEAARAEARRQAKAESQARRVRDVRHLSGSPAAMADAAQTTRIDAMLPAEDWLQRIREHRDNGALQDARDSLRAFVEAHPGHPVPDDLKPLLDPP